MWDPEFGGSRSGTGPEFSNLAGPGKVPGPELLHLSGPGSNFKSNFLTKHDFFIIYSYLKLTKCILCIRCKRIIKNRDPQKNFRGSGSLAGPDFGGPGRVRVPGPARTGTDPGPAASPYTTL